jgi:hypothetical protein
VVEATVPAIHGQAGETMSRRNPLLATVERAVPDGWSAEVEALPDLGPDDPKQAFRRAVQALLTDLPPASAGAAPIIRSTELATGLVRMRLLPRRPGWPAVAAEPAVTSWDDTAERVGRAVRRKRAQVRGAEVPVLLAIKAWDMAGSFEGFDVALYGHRVEMLGAGRRSVGTRFDRDGVFFSGGRTGPPTIAGVLAFRGAGFLSEPACVLFLHPRFEGRLPEPLLSLEVRTFDEHAQRIQVQAPRPGA